MKAALALLTLVAVAAAPAPKRVASLNLCTDELALLLAASGQLVSVSRLGGDPQETALARRARGLKLNNGRIDDVAALAPDLVLTSGGIGGTTAAALAARMGVRVVVLPFPATIGDVHANIRAVAAALGRQTEGEAAVARLDAALGPVPALLTPALMTGGGGVAPAADGLDAEFLRHAGLRQIVGGETVRLEAILANPPQVLVLSRYRDRAASLNTTWLRHPALARLPARVRRAETDGRAWTCAGPETAEAVAALRAALPPSPLRGGRLAPLRERGGGTALRFEEGKAPPRAAPEEGASLALPSRGRDR